MDAVRRRNKDIATPKRQSRSVVFVKYDVSKLVATETAIPLRKEKKVGRI
jgi:hypothetical protein